MPHKILATAIVLAQMFCYNGVMEICSDIHLILEVVLLSVTAGILATAVLTLATTMVLLRYARQVSKGVDTTMIALELMARKVQELWFSDQMQH